MNALFHYKFIKYTVIIKKKLHVSVELSQSTIKVPVSQPTLWRLQTATKICIWKTLKRKYC